MSVNAAKRHYKGQLHCGDQYAWWHSGTKKTLCMVDGLGHGLFAEQAAQAAIAYVKAHFFQSLPEIFSGCNAAIQHTWGVVMGIAVIDEDKGTLTYAGIGNTRTGILRNSELGTSIPRTSYMISNPGIVGGGYRKLKPQTAVLEPRDLVIMYTDGVRELIDFSGYDPALLSDPQRLCEKIIDDWGRETDDAAVLVYRFD